MPLKPGTQTATTPHGFAHSRRGYVRASRRGHRGGMLAIVGALVAFVAACHPSGEPVAPGASTGSTTAVGTSGAPGGGTAAAADAGAYGVPCTTSCDCPPGQSLSCVGGRCESAYVVIHCCEPGSECPSETNCEWRDGGRGLCP